MSSVRRHACSLASFLRFSSIFFDLLNSIHARNARHMLVDMIDYIGPTRECSLASTLPL